MSEVVYIARCPEHGLHGQRDECFVCGGDVDQVAMRPVGDRFGVFTVGELQAMVMAFAEAGAYLASPRRPFDHPVWLAIAREAAATLERAAEDDGWDSRIGTAAS